MGLHDLQTLGDAQRTPRATGKGPSRLEAVVAERKLTRVDEKAFRLEVHTRDGGYCRVCGRKAIKVLGRVPERAEVHHLHGRVGDLRFESRAAILTCLQCHERLTGRVNQHRLVVIASKTFETRQGTFTDARCAVTFKELR